MRLAAIDIGTNSTKMTLADVDTQGQLSVLAEDTDVTRLGEGVDASKRLGDDPMERTLDAIVRFAEQARQQGASTVLAAGTSALRDASNGPDFLAQAQTRAGVTIEIITGDREAQLAYAAVRSDPSLHLSADAPLLVFDIGGGSTELILGDASGVGRHKSLDIGAVRLTERFLTSDPPASSEVFRAAQYADDLLHTFDAPESTPVVAGIGGTAVNIAAVTLAARTGDPRPDVHGATLAASDVQAALMLFQSVPLTARRSIPGLEPKRADVIIAGALILHSLLTRFAAPSLVVSVRGLRYGLLADYAAHHS
jgi:exopolyphosphatase/guanosine-5'-triphosphate,3'-diphosphate pyrophosphatase